MQVIRIRDYQGRDIVEALIDLLERAQDGKLRGFAFAIKIGPHNHRIGITGDYWGDPGELLACATRLEYKLNVMMDGGEDTGPPTRTMPL